MVRDDSKILAAQKQTGRQYITFYSAAGKQLTQLLVCFVFLKINCVV